jgi:predicted MFS family arabinose efflux permease
MAWIGAKIGYYFGLSWPFLIAGVLALVSSAVLWFVLNNGDDSEDQKKDFHPWRNFYQNISQGRQIIVSHQRLALLFGICFIISMMVQPMNMQWAVLYEARFNTVDTSSPVFVQVLGTIIGASLLTLFCAKVRGMIAQFIYLVIVIAVTIFAIPIFGDWGAFMVILFVHELPRGMVMPLRSSWTGEFVEDDERRATVNSYFGMIWTLAAGSGLALSGFWAEWWGIKFAWQAISMIGLVCLVVLLIFHRLKSKQKILK